MDHFNAQKKIRKYCKILHCPSISVFYTDGKQDYSYAYGYSDKERRINSYKDTYYYLASCSKAFTALLACIAHEEKLIDLYAPLSQQGYADLFFDKDTSDNVTLSQMLSHQTGLPRHELMQLSCSTREEMARKVKFLLPNAKLGQAYQYQNQVYVLIGYILEQLFGKSWEQLVKEKIFEPLGIKGRFRGIDAIDDNTALPYWCNGLKSKRAEQNLSFIDNPCGGILLDNEGVGKWLHFLLNKGEGIISKETFEMMITPQIITSAEPNGDGVINNGYAFGWTTGEYLGQCVVSHGGVNIGYQSDVTFYPEKGCAVAVLTNCLGIPIHLIAEQFIKDALFDVNRKNYFSYFAKKYLPKKSAKHSVEQSKDPTPIICGKYYDEGYGQIEVISENGRDYLRYYGNKYEIVNMNGYNQANVCLGQKCRLSFCDNSMDMEIFSNTIAKVKFINEE